jgi:hypothetical protein
VTVHKGRTADRIEIEHLIVASLNLGQPDGTDLELPA